MKAPPAWPLVVVAASALPQGGLAIKVVGPLLNVSGSSNRRALLRDNGTSYAMKFRAKSISGRRDAAWICVLNVAMETSFWTTLSSEHRLCCYVLERFVEGTPELRPYDVAVDAIRENYLVHTSQAKPWRGHRGPTAYLSECLETGRGLCTRGCAQTRDERVSTTKITEELLLKHQDHHRRFRSLCRTRPTSKLFFKPPMRSMMSRLLVYVRRLLSPFCISSSFFLSMC